MEPITVRFSPTAMRALEQIAYDNCLSKAQVVRLATDGTLFQYLRDIKIVSSLPFTGAALAPLLWDILSRGWDGGLSGAALSALAGRPRRAPFPRRPFPPGPGWAAVPVRAARSFPPPHVPPPGAPPSAFQSGQWRHSPRRGPRGGSVLGGSTLWAGIEQAGLGIFLRAHV